MKKSNGEQPQQLFLFVNKDSKSKSLSKSEGNSAKEINRHAQKVRNRRLAAQKASTSQSTSESARRIALGGWQKRDGESDSPGSDGISPRSPEIVPFLGSAVHELTSTPNYTSTSESSSRSSGSPPATSPDEPPISVPQKPPTSCPQKPAVESTVVRIVDHNFDPQVRILEDEREIEEEQDHGFNDLAVELPFRAFTPKDSFDPFNQLPIRITDQIHQVLQSTLRIYPYSGNNYKLVYLPAHIRSNIRQFPIAEVVQRAVTKPHHLYSLLACISIRLQTAFQGNIPGDIPKTFQNYASHHLNKELVESSKSGALDRTILLDILFLVVGEIGTGDFESAREHLGVVSKFYHLLDLRQNLDFWISESCAHVDNQLALSSGQPPVLKQTFDPGPLLPERRAALRRELQWLMDHAFDPKPWYPSPMSLAVKAPPRGLKDAIFDFGQNLDLRMGIKYEEALKTPLLNDLMRPIIADITDCVAIAKVVWLSPQAVCFDAEWLCRKARAVLRRLLVIAPENNIGPLDVVGKCMEAVRCTLLIVMSHACTLIGATTAKLNVVKLQNALAFALKFWCPPMGLTPNMEATDERYTYPLVQFSIGHILYDSMVGVFSADIPGFESTYEWFMQKVLNSCKLLGIKNAHDLREHMVQYLYSPVLQEKSIAQAAARLSEVWRNERVVYAS